MKSKKLVITLSTALILSTSAIPVFAHGISYNPRFSYDYGQSYNGYKNNNRYNQHFNGYEITMTTVSI